MAENFTLPQGFKVIEQPPETNENFTLPQGFKVLNAPGIAETFGREYLGGISENLAEELLSSGRDPNQPIYMSGNQRARAKYLAEQAGEPFGFDEEAQKQYKESQLAEQMKRKQAGIEANPTAAGIANVAGEVTPYFIPIPGIRAAKFGTRIGAEALRGGAVAGAQSDAEIGSQEWANDVGLGGVGGVVGAGAAKILEKSGKLIGKGTRAILDKGALKVARDMRAKEMISRTGAMRAKYQGKIQILNTLPYGQKIAAKFDNWIINKILKTNLSAVGKKTKEQRAMFDNLASKSSMKGVLGKGTDLLAHAYDATGGITSITTAAIYGAVGGGIIGVSTGELAAAYKGIFAAAGFKLLADAVTKSPEVIYEFVRGSRYAAPLRIAVKAGPDALRAAIVYASQNEDFRQMLIDGVWGEGTYEKVEGPIQTDFSLPQGWKIIK